MQNETDNISGLRCSQYVKSRGFASLKELSQDSGVKLRTLQAWYKDRRSLFELVLNGTKVQKVCGDVVPVNKLFAIVEAIVNAIAGKRER